MDDIGRPAIRVASLSVRPCMKYPGIVVPVDSYLRPMVPFCNAALGAVSYVGTLCVDVIR